MKKFLIPIIALVSVLFTSCEDELLSKELELNQPVTFTLTIPANQDTSFSIADTLALTENATLSEFADKIQSASITSLEMTLSNLQGGNGGDGSDCSISLVKANFSSDDHSGVLDAEYDLSGSSLKDFIDSPIPNIVLNSVKVEEFVKAFATGTNIKYNLEATEAKNSATEAYTIDVTFQISGTTTVGL